LPAELFSVSKYNGDRHNEMSECAGACTRASEMSDMQEIQRPGLTQRDPKKQENRRAARSIICISLSTLAAAFVFGLVGCVATPEEGGESSDIGVVTVTREDFVGSGACKDCHEEITLKWEKTLHARMMQDPKEKPDAILGDMTQNLPFKKEDIAYSLGNHWTQRYMTEIDGEYYVLPRMWSIQSREWLPYSIFSWKRKPWRVFCAGCHTTGFDHETGTFVETSIGCEACHGPGGKHAKDPSRTGLIVNPNKLSEGRALMICEACHVRGRDNGNSDYCFPLQYLPGDDLARTYTPLDLEDGADVTESIHTLYDEWKEKLIQPEGSSCELCQNFRAPQKSSEPSESAEEKEHESNSTLICHTCHAMAKKKEDDHSHHPPDVVCTDCHVPSFSKSGESQDIHSHRFQFKTPSKYLAYEPCYETKLQESCSTCHDGKSTNWAIKVISEWKVKPFKKFHKVGD
jgi:hypothetical protein